MGGRMKDFLYILFVKILGLFILALCLFFIRKYDGEDIVFLICFVPMLVGIVLFFAFDDLEDMRKNEELRKRGIEKAKNKKLKEKKQ